MWDNRTTKKGKQPDFKCRDKKCDKPIWLPKTEGYGNEQVLRDQFFDQAERFMVSRNLPEDKRKEALGRLVVLNTEEMGKAVDKLVTGGKPSEEREREKRLAELINHEAVTAEMIQQYCDENFKGTPPEKLSLAALDQMYSDLASDSDIPF